MRIAKKSTIIKCHRMKQYMKCNLHSLAKTHFICQNTIQLIVIQGKHPLQPNLSSQRKIWAYYIINLVEYENIKDVASHKLIISQSSSFQHRWLSDNSLTHSMRQIIIPGDQELFQPNQAKANSFTKKLMLNSIDQQHQIVQQSNYPTC